MKKQAAFMRERYSFDSRSKTRAMSTNQHGTASYSLLRVSRMMPGRKDFVSVRKDGKRVHV